MRLHHVQLCLPRGGEHAARRFYIEGLGMTEVEKPVGLRGRGGCWFRSYDGQGDVLAEIHLGVEEPFAPARKAHPGLLVDDLDAVSGRLQELGFALDHTERETFEGYLRFHTYDAAGNRVEIMSLAG
ncbi:MAG: VOC family protein [Actinomycetota bacterium]|nr:VOC family protein [Actinomycetota bacterium]